MSNKHPGVALVGYGLAGEVFHAPLLKTTEGLEVTVIATSNSERKKKASEAFPKATIVDSFDTALKSHSEKFELVVIASPNKWH